MSDGTKVGSGYIEITPEISRPGLSKAQRDLKNHLSQMGKAADREFSRQQREVVGGFNKQMKALQKGKTSGIFAEQRAEMDSFKKLQKQRDAAMKDQARAFEGEKKKIADSISAQKSLDAQRQKSIESMRREASARGKIQLDAIAKSADASKALQKQKDDAFAAEKKAQDRTIAELSAWHDKKQALEKADRAEADKASKQYLDDQAKAAKYRELRALGASPEHAAAGATGRPMPGGSNVASQMARLGPVAKNSGNVMAKAFDNASHTLSQLSTRIGLTGFQLQLLGLQVATLVTGPAAMLFGGMARDGLKFAASIDYARASMKALLGPTVNVEKVINDIKKMAIDSPLFNTEDAISYAQKLASVGVKGNDLYKSMQALSNIMLTQGVAGPERANLAMMAYTQILSKGAIGMDDLRQQFAEHVPDGMRIFQTVAKRLGYDTIKGLSDAMKDGTVTAEKLNAEFIKFGNTPKFLEGATAAAQTLGGVWQAFNEEIQTKIGSAFDANRKKIIAAINGIRPVVMSFIDWVVKNIPTMLISLNGLVLRIQDLKKSYDALNPAQKELIGHVIAITLAAGPAAVALGTLLTALSAVANAASLASKGLALVGVGSALTGGIIALVVVAIAAIAGALIYLYNTSEGIRKAILQVFNQIKDFISSVFLPVVNLLIGSVQSLEKTFGFLGLKSEHLAYVLYLLLIPVVAVMQVMLALTLVIKSVQLVMLVLSSIAYGLFNTIAYLLMGWREFFNLLAKIPGAPKVFKEIADAADTSAKKLSGLIDVSGQWKGLTEGNSHATDGFKSKLAGLDLTTTGLIGGFQGWNAESDIAIKKQITLEQAINNAREAMNGQVSATKSLQDASDGYNKSLLSMKESIKQNGKGLNEKTAAGQRNRDMLKAATTASYELMLQDIRSGVPMEQAIKRHRDRTNALKGEFGKSKETQAAAQKLIDTYGKVPKDVKTLLETMGYTDVAKKMQEILAAQKVAANPKMSYSAALQAERKAWRLEKGEGLKNNGMGKKDGGIIRGPGGPTGDKIPIMASDEEYMIRAAAAKNLGKPMLDYINKTGSLPIGGMYAKGGAVQWPVKFDLSDTKFPEMLGGDPNGGGVGWQKMMAVLRQQFPGLPLISGYRPGAITSTGNQSYHAVGRAVDLPPSWDVFNWISQNYGRGTKELIYTPAGGRQIKNGQLHNFTGGTIEQDHYNHVHWAYDNGGLIAPNQPFINKTGSNELALNSAQGAALEDKITNSDRPVYVSVYVDGVKRDAEIVFEEKTDELIRALGGA